jgi:hypothetical protein
MRTKAVAAPSGTWRIPPWKRQAGQRPAIGKDDPPAIPLDTGSYGSATTLGNFR